MLYLSILRRSRLTPGTVSTSPSQEAASWNSLKRQAATQPVVDLERPTWQLTMTGQLTAEPSRVLQRVSKSASVGAAELQTGILWWTRPGNSSSSFLTESRVTLPSSAYSPILLGGRAQMGLPFTYTIGSWRMLSQMILLVLG